MRKVSKKLTALIDGLKRAQCRYCGAAGQTRLCGCEFNLKLARSNYRADWFKDNGGSGQAGPLSTLPN